MPQACASEGMLTAVVECTPRKRARHEDLTHFKERTGCSALREQRARSRRPAAWQCTIRPGAAARAPIAVVRTKNPHTQNMAVKSA
eukprot:CAMPEP_0179038262 /NCGR_PEP_ID=MMETSP0796-20121207/14543_1 /TAXON_ID=73915 /ORGANISM="Pyrodinium bahamense, Strain pbaha01" /LENGTH=85 /DNA_ID=CAMNT_0020734575 /DNA_START=42 /DNA_END=299 /DNA_ORIENTATION=+